MLNGCLNTEVEEGFVEWLITQEGGIYYIYDHSIKIVPEKFESRQESRFLGAVELLADYNCAGNKLKYVADWLESNRKPSGKWDMGPATNDQIYFPLSDDWRSKYSRENDCTERIEQLMNKLGNIESESRLFLNHLPLLHIESIKRGCPKWATVNRIILFHRSLRFVLQRFIIRKAA